MRCSRCFTEFDDRLPFCPVCNQPSPGRMYAAGGARSLAGIAGSPFMLALAILSTLLTVLQFVSIVSDFFGFLVFASFIIQLLGTIGLWTLYTSASKESITFSSFGLIRCIPVYGIVSSSIVMGLCLLGSVISFAGAGEIFEILEDELSDVYLNIANLTVGWIAIALAVVLLIVLIAVTFMLIYYIRMNAILKKISRLVIFGVPYVPKENFFCVLSFVLAFFQLVGGFTIFFFAPLSALSSLISCGMKVLFAVFFLLNREKIGHVAVGTPLEGSAAPNGQPNSSYGQSNWFYGQSNQSYGQPYGQSNQPSGQSTPSHICTNQFVGSSEAVFRSPGSEDDSENSKEPEGGTSPKQGE